MRSVFGAVLLALVATMLVLAPGPALAASGSVASSNGVLYDSCRDHSYSYSLSPDSSDWELDITLVGPDGSNVDWDYKTSSIGDPSSGTGRFQFCGYERPGRYTLSAELTSYDASYNGSTVSLPDSNFYMRKPRSRTRLRVSDKTPHYNEVVRFRSKSLEERPRGFYGISYATVQLQVKTRKGWVRVKGSKQATNDRGKAVWRYRWNVRRNVRIRAVTLRSSDYERSHSRRVRIRTTAGGRMSARSTATTRAIGHVVP